MEEESEGGDEAVAGDDDKNRVIYKPSIDDCKKFVLNSMDMIIKSTN